MSIVSILIAIVIIALVWWVLDMIPLPPRIKQIITVLLVIILILWLLQFVGVDTGIRLH